MKKWKKLSAITMVIMAALLLVLSPASALAQTGEDTAPGPRPLRHGALAIVAPGGAGVNQKFSARVFLRANQEPFQSAGVWAFTQEEAEALREEIKALRESANQTGADVDYEEIADARGIFIGRTGEDGRVHHSFDTAGVYVLAAFRKGFFPGFTRINIREMPNALAIQAPNRAPVGEEVTMTVTKRGTDEPMMDAGVWAVTRENGEVLREELTLLRQNTDIPAESKDYAAVVDAYGEFLGRTDANGQLTHIFEVEGGYGLVAAMIGYIPGFTGIHIGELPKALAIDAPKRAPVGEDVLMTVTQRGTEEAVEDAGVWAITRENAEVIREELILLRENKDISAEDKDFEALANAYGTFLARTDESGQLSYAFEAGGYMLMTVKPGYFPGFTGIHIGEKIQGLALKAPRSAKVGEEVTLSVLGRGTEEAVEGAGIWAISMDNLEGMQEDMTALREDSGTPAAEKDFESVADGYGIFLGRTDENGHLNVAFDSAGGYLLITIKPGYFPGMAPIRIVDETKADTLKKRGVPGEGINKAPGLQKNFNDRAGNAGRGNGQQNPFNGRTDA